MKKDNKLKEFKKAIHFLKRKERIRSNADLAAAMDISPSYLSQLVNANKPFPEMLYGKFEKHFSINLADPFTYTDLDWISPSDQKPKPLQSDNQLFRRMKKLLRLKEEETTNQQKIIKAQEDLIQTLQKEIETMKPLYK